METTVLYATENPQETSELMSKAVIKQFTSHVYTLYILTRSNTTIWLQKDFSQIIIPLPSLIICQIWRFCGKWRQYRLLTWSAMSLRSVNSQFFCSLSPPTSSGTDVVTDTGVHCLPIQYRVALGANTPPHEWKRTRNPAFTHPSKGQSQCCVTWKILDIKANL